MDKLQFQSEVCRLHQALGLWRSYLVLTSSCKKFYSFFFMNCFYIGQPFSKMHQNNCDLDVFEQSGFALFFTPCFFWWFLHVVLMFCLCIKSSDDFNTPPSSFILCSPAYGFLPMSTVQTISEILTLFSIELEMRPTPSEKLYWSLELRPSLRMSGCTSVHSLGTVM